MSEMIEHRGPDGAGMWFNSTKSVGFAHRRLAIIDLTNDAAQPMVDAAGRVVTYNGEIYNYIELQRELSDRWSFRTRSDTECILAAYDRFGFDAPTKLRGMFAFALWDEPNQRLFCARDRFGIKPFYYCMVGGVFMFASEAKALVPFLPSIETDELALSEYLTFNYTLGESTLFRGVKQLLPGQSLTLEGDKLTIRTYWDVQYRYDYSRTPAQWREALRESIGDSLAVHLRSDVPVGSYLSGGVDSSLIAILAAQHSSENADAFHGKFTQYPGYDESAFAELAAERAGSRLHQIDITAEDFRQNIEKVIYHLDFPVAGPGSFPQYMVSGLASKTVKVVLGGQGGDEIFGGYARYMLVYLERLLKAALDGEGASPDLPISLEQLSGNLSLLREYKPMMSQLWAKGLFEPTADRYFRVVDRSADMSGEVNWQALDVGHPKNAFMQIFNDPTSIDGEQPLDRMTRFDFKTLLPGLLQVEDRMSMAHGIESRVPLLDHHVMEMVASIPPDIRYDQGRLKGLLKGAFDAELPAAISGRRDKMGFPIPLREWLQSDLRDYVNDTFRSARARNRPFMNSERVLETVDSAGRYSRKLWGLLSLELWHQQFHDTAADLRRMAS